MKLKDIPHKIKLLGLLKSAKRITNYSVGGRRVIVFKMGRKGVVYEDGVRIFSNLKSNANLAIFISKYKKKNKEKWIRTSRQEVTEKHAQYVIDKETKLKH